MIVRSLPRAMAAASGIVLALVVTACGGASSPPTATPEPSTAAHGHGHGHGHEHGHHGGTIDPVEKKLDEVAAIHGAPGPWAVAGYRMSEHALARLGLERGSFDLQIVHWTPKEVRYSCIADGAAAHSGASLGKLNLSLVETTPDNVLTIYRNTQSGKSVALRPTASFRERYADTPREKARELGREVLALPPDQIFEEIPVK
jgi:formylmethanofuran dehydrogenase subunit E